jgi:hypothetical protein
VARDERAIFMYFVDMHMRMDVCGILTLVERQQVEGIWNVCNMLMKMDVNGMYIHVIMRHVKGT